MPGIHQFVAGFSRGDAISNEALTLRRIFQSWQRESRIYCEARRILPELRREALDYSAYNAIRRPDDVALLHLSIGSPVNEFFATLPCRKAILYHNVTPPDYFRFIQPATAHLLALGRRQAQALAGAARVNLADSRFNAAELEQWGYADVRVFPLMLDAAREGEQDRRVIAQARDGKVNVLFVGRCAPNKKIEDALLAFAYFQRFVAPDSRFVHVGSYAGTERYYHWMLSLVRELQLANVRFTGSVPPAQLNAWYACADLFLCMSEHEGFCIPLLESMQRGVPVLAYAAGAVPETLDGAGILVREKNYPLIAELMGAVTRDRALREAVIRGQQERVTCFSRRDPAAELRALLDPLLK
jgi:glycosyltransferase involved in cell wall biosynthesis